MLVFFVGFMVRLILNQQFFFRSRIFAVAVEDMKYLLIRRDFGSFIIQAIFIF